VSLVDSTSSARTYEPDDALATPTCGANGNLASDGRWTYCHDEENVLRQAARPATTVDSDASAWAAARRAQPEYIRHTLCYAAPVKHYAWDPAKNEWLKRERGVSFEDVVFHIEAGDEVDLLEHPNQQRYPGQKISVVLIEGCADLVPFVDSESEIFLKTIVPSRKLSRPYLGESDEQT